MPSSSATVNGFHDYQGAGECPAADMSRNDNFQPSNSGEAQGQQLFSFEDGIMIEGEPTWERMGKIARLCASAVERHFGESLDFTPESVVKLDRVIVSGWGETYPTREVPVNVRVSFGAYLGELIVRRSPGRWVSGWSEEEPATILFLNRKDELLANVSPFRLVDEKFAGLYRFDLSVAWAALEQKLQEVGVS